ncbi:MAG: hypothetical protein AAGE89_17990 [Pseudomonadota bacterium]
MSRQMVLLIALFFITSMNSIQPAYAYLDPGTGTVILQGIIAAASGALAFGYYYINRIKQFLGLAPKDDPTADGLQEESDNPLK